MPDQKPTLEYARRTPQRKREPGEKADSVFELFGLICFIVLVVSVVLAVIVSVLLAIGPH